MTGAVSLTAAPTDVGAAASWTAGTEYTVEPQGGEIVLVETGSAAVRFPRTRGDRPAIRSAGYVQTENLGDPRYVLPTKRVE